jgi:hypothetical protein
MLEGGTQLLKADKASTDLWNVCVLSVIILNNEDLFIHKLNDMLRIIPGKYGFTLLTESYKKTQRSLHQ